MNVLRYNKNNDLDAEQLTALKTKRVNSLLIIRIKNSFVAIVLSFCFLQRRRQYISWTNIPVSLSLPLVVSYIGALKWVAHARTQI